MPRTRHRKSRRTMGTPPPASISRPSKVMFDDFACRRENFAQLRVAALTVTCFEPRRRVPRAVVAARELDHVARLRLVVGGGEVAARLNRDHSRRGLRRHPRSRSGSPAWRPCWPPRRWHAHRRCASHSRGLNRPSASCTRPRHPASSRHWNVEPVSDEVKPKLAELARDRSGRAGADRRVRRSRVRRRHVHRPRARGRRGVGVRCRVGGAHVERVRPVRQAGVGLRRGARAPGAGVETALERGARLGRREAEARRAGRDRSGRAGVDRRVGRRRVGRRGRHGHRPGPAGGRAVRDCAAASRGAHIECVRPVREVRIGLRRGARAPGSGVEPALEGRAGSRWT